MRRNNEEPSADGVAEYPGRVKESAQEMTEGAADLLEWAKLKASDMANAAVDYAAIGAEKAIEMKERFKKQVNDYRENKQ